MNYEVGSGNYQLSIMKWGVGIINYKLSIMKWGVGEKIKSTS
jgi:hypothetical protein